MAVIVASSLACGLALGASARGTGATQRAATVVVPNLIGKRITGTVWATLQRGHWQTTNAAPVFTTNKALSGEVAAQSPKPGTRLRRGVGQLIHLRLYTFRPTSAAAKISLTLLHDGQPTSQFVQNDVDMNGVPSTAGYEVALTFTPPSSLVASGFDYLLDVRYQTAPFAGDFRSSYVWTGATQSFLRHDLVIPRRAISERFPLFLDTVPSCYGGPLHLTVTLSILPPTTSQVPITHTKIADVPVSVVDPTPDNYGDCTPSSP